MLKCALRLLPIIVVATLMFGGCKLDAPVYPKPIDKTDTTKTDTTITDTVTVPDVDDGSNPPTDANYTIAIGAANTIVFQVDGGETVTLDRSTANVDQPGSVAITGYTSLLANQPDPEIFIQLNFSSIVAGEYANDLLGLQYNTLKLSDDGSGKVKTTTYKKIDGSYHIRGFFRVNATNDTDGMKHMVVGSFNIEQ
jgi:hypothetical protein